MRYRFVSTPPKNDQKMQLVEMDEGICFLDEGAQGFKTYGVSSCIVLVGYFNNRLLFMTHFSTPDSTTPHKFAMQYIKRLFNQLLKQCRPYLGPLLEIYAIGGQESSQNTMDALRSYVKSYSRVKVNVDHLHLVHHEDYFDLYVPRTSKQLLLEHVPVLPDLQIQEDLIKVKDHPAPLLYALAFMASNMPKLPSIRARGEVHEPGGSLRLLRQL